LSRGYQRKQTAYVTAHDGFEEHLWNFSEFQRVHLSNLVWKSCLSVRMSDIRKSLKDSMEFGIGGFTLKVLGRFNFGSYQSNITYTLHEVKIEFTFSCAQILYHNWTLPLLRE
jgi:hypothetical protein